MPSSSEKVSFEQIIEKYRENSTSERNKGDKFERLMQAYLLTKPIYKNLLSDVWLWSDFPYKKEFGTGGKDTGIDLVCRTHEGDYWAVQCKCYQADKKIDKAMVDSFVSTSSFEFETKDGKKTFSFRIWIDTTYDGFNAEAQNVVERLKISRIGLIDLKNDDVDWAALDAGKKGSEASVKKYELKPHQQEAFDDTIKYFENHERGKLIMACGTGKTFTSLRIAEAMAKESHLVLFLVPSIALLSQTLKEWSAQSQENLYPICICSDSHASDKAEDSISDLVLPATTDAKKVYQQFIDYRLRQQSEGGMIVVFSTYQSIDVISTVQEEINSLEKDSFIFDLIICDEAHRTTGIKQKDKIQSSFTKVHSNDNIKAKKRLYMTATPRLYSSEAQAKAREKEIEVWSMDAPEWFGEEIHRIGFGAAVEKQLLSDYKVIVLTLDENSVDPQLLKELLEGHADLEESDAIKLIGCINVLSKRTNYLTDKELFSDVDPEPMKSAVAFCSSIKNSKYLRDSFNVCQQAYYEKMTEEEREQLVVVQSDHIDGSMGSTVREEKLDWLKKANPNKKECRVLNNVRCLSEGVDVPSLDAIMFLSSRNSQVDVVQSVGRVMRRAVGKKFGYIIIPVIVPADKNADEVLDDSNDFKIVWSVLNALRAHDDRFNATINKIELNKKKPRLITITGGDNFGGKPIVGGDDDEPVQGLLDFDEMQQKLYDKFQTFTGQVFAKIVNKCGSRRYWADWGKDVGEIAKRNIERINKLIEVDGEHKDKFNTYWEGLKKNLNPSVNKDDAVEMLAQHMITKPVFEALFGNDHFTKENPVSKSLEEIVKLLDEKSDPEDLDKLDRFYKQVQERAEGIDNAEGKQKVVVELYDSFFKNAFPMTVEKLGIVYTPVPVVDFIIHSVEWVLNKEFGRSISDEKVNVIDPFTGTGTFITRLLQAGIIKPEDLERKYKHEIFANEIVLLAYYIASVNIENAYHDLSGKDTYEPFGGICLTDTFQLYENGDPTLDDKVFSENSDRVNEQKKQPITVVMGNPPYSVGQKSANDNAQNQSYAKLEGRIAETYVALSEATNKNSTYDSYIKAFRWASDRLNKTDGGIIAFVSNGSWIDGNAQDGFRKTIEKEFSSIYVFNLRGNQRTSGELSRKEGGKIFGSGSRTPISITLLVKKYGHSGKAKILYHDIGDYLSREDKLKIVSDFHDVGQMKLEQITPNEHGDWISQRNDKFGTWIPVEPTEKFASDVHTYFTICSNGLKTGRDAWSYCFSKEQLKKQISSCLNFYESQRQDFISGKTNEVTFDTTKISWDESVMNKCRKGTEIKFDKDCIITGHYRPFCKENLYFDSNFIQRVYRQNFIFPRKNSKNLVIAVAGLGASKDYSVLISDFLPDLGFNTACQCFPLYWYETIEQEQGSLFGDEEQIVKHEAISDFILERAQSKYGNKVQREDIFYYVYGILHSKSYRETFSADLKKMLPRIPLVSDYEKFWAFSKAGRELANLHLNYESIEPCPGVVVESLERAFYETPKQVRGDRNDSGFWDNMAVAETPKKVVSTDSTTGEDYAYYEVQQMKFPKKGQKDTIIYNHWHTIKNIPEKAYEYVVNGKSAIEWIMERYAITTDTKSGITNNPNDWSREHEKPCYILDLLLSVINVSVQTVDIVNNLPEVDWDKE